MKGTYVKRGDKWRARAMVNGVRHTKSFSTKREAQEWVARLVADGSTVDPSKVTLASLADRYGKEVSSKKAGEEWELKRLTMYKRDHGYLFDKKVTEIEFEHVQQFINNRLPDVKGSTINRDLALIRDLFKFARRLKLIKHNPTADLITPSDPPPRERRVSQEEIDRVLFCLDFEEGQPVTQQRHKVAIAFLLAIETAMRQGELAKITWDDVHLDERIVALPHSITKTRMPRKVPLSQRAIDLINMLPKNKKLVFGVTSDVMSTMSRRAIALAGIDDMTFHDTRHEATTRLAKHVQVLDLARITGHKDIKRLLDYYNKDASEIAESLP